MSDPVQYQLLRAETEDLRVKLAADATRIAGALVLHPRARDLTDWCPTCSVKWPCATVLALATDAQENT
jgi:hypothetical protein